MALVNLTCLALLLLSTHCHGLAPSLQPTKSGARHRNPHLMDERDDLGSFSVGKDQISSSSRRSFFQSVAFSSLAIALGSLTSPNSAHAATRSALEDLLYTILRVREATQQETRLIKSGKFKDVQRANVKLAVKFMIENYRLNDAFVAASNYLDGNNKRMAAVNTGQAAVQDLYTILEYFDASDVQNLKVSEILCGHLF